MGGPGPLPWLRWPHPQSPPRPPAPGCTWGRLAESLQAGCGGGLLNPEPKLLGGVHHTESCAAPQGFQAGPSVQAPWVPGGVEGRGEGAAAAPAHRGPEERGCWPWLGWGVGCPGSDGPLRCPGRPAASVFDLKAISRLLLLPGVLPVFLIKVVSGFPSGLFMIMFSIISMDFFRLEAAQAGYLMSYFGVLQMVIQGLVIGWLSSRFSEGALLRASVLVFSLVGLAMALMSSTFHFCLLVPGLVFSLCTMNVVTDSMLAKAVPASDTGTMLGLSASVQPLTRTLGPSLGGLLYRSFGVAVFGHVQFAVNFLVLLALWRRPLPRKSVKVQ
ncbi:solute carrier family 22 member 18 [Choloepus didactylus]|uniref:solute carrier family 22 member 18 n=1 Tax=Choloepus didactylus TaxID=27675 RepID=UPI00189FFE7B|nr:solute carrier family 22 member 18 [Choloepus didactylus]